MPVTLSPPIDDRRARFPLVEVEQSIASRFEAQVARFPRRIAVSAAETATTYEEVDEHANRIAWAVIECGAGASVALLMDHGPLVPAAVMGVFKAARCAVPLPMGQPADRNRAVLADAGVGTILTDRLLESAARSLAASLPVPPAIVNVEDLAGRSGRPPGIPLADPHDPCFIIYTSGSTGAPKGVVQEHRMTLFGCLTYTNLAALDATDRLSWLQSISTVAGVTALFGALLNGGTICPFQAQRRGLHELADWIDAERISILHTVPTLFRRLGHWLPTGRRFEGVRLLRLGGEAVTATEVALLRAHLSSSGALLAGLGSTEAGNFRQSVYAVDDIPGDPVLPVGDPVPGRHVALVGAGGLPVPPGETGEIVVSSEFLFKGYWQRPELTAAVLAVDPTDPGRRRFRTGDFGRMAADGRLFHVGRADAQVKVAGNRVETAEVELALRQLDAVRDAAVVPAQAADGDTTLVAFVSLAAAADGAPTARALRVQLQAALPGYMIPRRFEVLPELPVLSGGKIDRAGLRGKLTSPREGWSAPRNPVEETVAAIWERALALRGIGVDDDFLADLGGDSLAAVQILADVHAVFGRDLPLEALLAAPTVAAMSARLGERGWVPAATDVLTLNATGTSPPLFAVCGAYGHAMRLLLVGQRMGSDRPLHALQPPGMDWERAGCTTLVAMAAHYRAEIQRRQAHGPYRLMGTSLGGVLMFEVAVQLQRAGEAVALLAMVDTMPPDCELPDGIDRAVRREWAEMVDPADRWVAAGARVASAHRRAVDGYLLRDRFEGRILYFHCHDAPVPPTGDRRAHWARFATGGVSVVPVPGIHGEFHRDPQCAAVARGLVTALADVV